MKTLIRYMVYSLHGEPLDASLYNDEQEAIKKAKEYGEAYVFAVTVKPYLTVYRPTMGEPIKYKEAIAVDHGDFEK